MNLTVDTVTSLKLLLKSLKMNRRAVEKNQAADGTTTLELTDYQDANSKMQDQVNSWLAVWSTQHAAPAPVPVPAGIMQPATPIGAPPPPPPAADDGADLVT